MSYPDGCTATPDTGDDVIEIQRQNWIKRQERAIAAAQRQLQAVKSMTIAEFDAYWNFDPFEAEQEVA